MSRQTIAMLLILGLVAVSFVEAGQNRNNDDKDDDDKDMRDDMDDKKDDDKEEEEDDKCYDRDCPDGMRCYQDECRLYCQKNGICDYGDMKCEVHDGHEYCPGKAPKKPKIPKCGGIEWCERCEEVKVAEYNGHRRLQNGGSNGYVPRTYKKVISCKACKQPAYRTIYEKSHPDYGEHAYTCAGGDSGY